MTFTLFPAVDVADGKAVRLTRGEAGSETEHGAALDVAREWQAAGATWIHLVDLDAAFGRGSNAELLASVVEELDVAVQLSGGISDQASLDQALSTGCARVNLATTAVEDQEWCARAIGRHGDRVSVSLDVRAIDAPDGTVQYRLAPRGSARDGGDLWETVARLDRAGCARYIVTDVGRDGMLGGPNVDLYRAVTEATSAPVIASGGISTIGDLTALAGLAAGGANLEGSIVGKALYAGRFTLSAALAAVR
ncbi:MAG: bifunctional 1-(5-phosphoribosyl)-5-((5-phosphoribosylamino)methylideneamino)imidazole-4-carboxamide isomerase/phosphoribosylanthranilate isomerase PriA [Ilumatobacteraceae bacterium]